MIIILFRDTYINENTGIKIMMSINPVLDMNSW